MSTKEKGKICWFLDEIYKIERRGIKIFEIGAQNQTNSGQKKKSSQKQNKMEKKNEKKFEVMINEIRMYHAGH